MFIEKQGAELQCSQCIYTYERGCAAYIAKCKGGWNGYFGADDIINEDNEQGFMDGIAGSVPSPLDVQVGGGHYKDFPIQPVEYCQKNQLNTCESNIVKYATRHKGKGGAEDIRKIIHYAQLILAIDYGE